jgi:hypothetical protein
VVKYETVAAMLIYQDNEALRDVASLIFEADEVGQYGIRGICIV